MIGTIFSKIFQFIRFILSYIPVLIYNKIYSQYLTRYSYIDMADQWKGNEKNFKRILDIGVGTGHPLYSIIDRIPKNVQVTGIDIDTNYIPAAKKIFSQHSNVEIKYMNFYDMEKEKTLKYDVIIFSSSFMLMPDRIKALEIAKNLLSDNGKIYFLMTLFQKKGIIQEMAGKVKPYLKYLTSIDFGQITYENEFTNIMKENGMNISYMKRLTSNTNLFLNTFRFFVIETNKA
ncbi:hypothetical protein ABPG72_020723 [Tetrahymena utriculariae]